MSPVHLVAYSDSEVKGGAEQTLGTLLAALGPDYRVTVVGTDLDVIEWIAVRRPGTETVLVPPASGKRDLRSIVAQIRAVRSLRPDIVHVNLGTPWHGQYGQLAGLLCPGAVVVAVENSPVWPTDPRQRRIKRRLSRRLGAHVACGEWLAREIEEIAELSAGDLRVIHNGIPDELPGPVDDPRWPCGTVIGTVGRLSAQKGYDVFLRALARIPDASGVVVGAGDEAGALADLAVELGLSDRILFTGWVDDPRAWLRRFDVFCLPSYMEGFPLTNLEAMLAGIPVVASDVGGVAEAVQPGHTGLLVPPGDVDALVEALSTYVADASLRAEVGARGRAQVEARFLDRHMACRFEALYDELRAAS